MTRVGAESEERFFDRSQDYLDLGFCREELMAWCEEQQPLVYYCSRSGL
jgi:hypothetical protein